MPFSSGGVCNVTPTFTSRTFSSPGQDGDRSCHFACLLDFLNTLRLVVPFDAISRQRVQIPQQRLAPNNEYIEFFSVIRSHFVLQVHHEVQERHTSSCAARRIGKEGLIRCFWRQCCQRDGSRPPRCRRRASLRVNQRRHEVKTVSSSYDSSHISSPDIHAPRSVCERARNDSHCTTRLSVNCWLYNTRGGYLLDRRVLEASNPLLRVFNLPNLFCNS